MWHASSARPLSPPPTYVKDGLLRPRLYEFTKRDLALHVVGMPAEREAHCAHNAALATPVQADDEIRIARGVDDRVRVDHEVAHAQEFYAAAGEGGVLHRGVLQRH